ncbi:hypothetical protein MJI69_27725, partial [Salmonella enterica subsp. enterica serovar Anatum]|nr:hypothetical protein [Salmonella enterica subsp. enterica serovar Anatum]
LDSANLNVKAMQASVDVALATLKQAQWQLSQTEVKAPVSGWVCIPITRFIPANLAVVYNCWIAESSIHRLSDAIENTTSDKGRI